MTLVTMNVNQLFSELQLSRVQWQSLKRVDVSVLALAPQPLPARSLWVRLADAVVGAAGMGGICMYFNPVPLGF